MTTARCALLALSQLSGKIEPIPIRLAGEEFQCRMRKQT
jgi:hypothetical protein